MKVSQDAFIGALSPEWKLIAEVNRISPDSWEQIRCHLRNAALEEAAKVCEALPNPYARDIERSDFADAIRALIKPNEPPTR